MSEEPNRDYSEEKRTSFLAPSKMLHPASGHITKIEQLTLTSLRSLGKAKKLEKRVLNGELDADEAIAECIEFFVQDYNTRSVAINGERASQISKVSKTNRYTPPPPEDGQKLSWVDRNIRRKKPED